MLRDNIKKFRNAKNMSQEELAVHLHVVRQTISKWEKGLSVPDAEVLIHMAQVLEVPVSALLDVEIPNTETADLTKELERLNQELSEANQRAALLHRADGKRNLILFLSFLSMLVSLAAEKEIISVLLSGLCILACLFILYRNLALLTAVTSDDLKPLHTLRTATLFNGALLLVCMAMTVLTGLDILTLSENQEKIFAILLISGIILFFGMISPRLPFTRHTGLRLPWTIRDEDTWNLAHKIIGFTSVPIVLLYLSAAWTIPNFETVSAAAVLTWIGIPGLVSFLYYWKKVHGRR